MKDKDGIEYSLGDFIQRPANRKTVIFGSGKYGEYIQQVLNENSIDLYAFCDNNTEIIGNQKNGVRIFGLSELLDEEDLTFIVAVADLNAKLKIKDQLIANGIDSNRIVIPLPYRREAFYDEMSWQMDEFRFGIIGIHWEKKRKENKICKYFVSNNLTKIVVYEDTQFTGWIEKDFENENIEIIQYISSIDTDIAKDADAVLILNEKYFEEIEDALMDKTSIPIIGIWEVVR